MSPRNISAALRQRVAEAARFRCGYCLTAQRIIGPLLEIDHFIPESRGGSSDEENLWLACPMCNSHKADRQEALDPESRAMVPLFSPRAARWEEHFEWIEAGTMRGSPGVPAGLCRGPGRDGDGGGRHPHGHGRAPAESRSRHGLVPPDSGGGHRTGHRPRGGLHPRRRIFDHRPSLERIYRARGQHRGERHWPAHRLDASTAPRRDGSARP